jgi:hypothetical protein
METIIKLSTAFSLKRSHAARSSNSSKYAVVVCQTPTKIWRVVLVLDVRPLTEAGFSGLTPILFILGTRINIYILNPQTKDGHPKYSVTFPNDDTQKGAIGG